MTLPNPAHSHRSSAAAAARYRTDGRGTVSAERGVVLLYERLDRDLADAIEALGDRRLEAAHRALVHAQEILDALDLSLDRSAWDGAEALGDLYAFVTNLLVDANVRKDPAPVIASRRVIAPLVEAWAAAWSTTAASAGPAALA